VGRTMLRGRESFKKLSLKLWGRYWEEGRDERRPSLDSRVSETKYSRRGKMISAGNVESGSEQLRHGGFGPYRPP
jgi:hypothetical protein